MSSQILDARWASWLEWVLANTIGAALSLAITFAAASIAGMGEERIAMFVLAPTVAICIGIAQSLVIRRYAPHAIWWAPISIAGLLVGAAAIGATDLIAAGIVGRDAVVETMQGATAMIVSLSLYGASIGIVQWLFLRRNIAHAGWWVLASAIGGSFLGVILGDSISRMVELIWIGTIPASITGIVLVWVLWRPMATIPGERSR
jgi:hypothetical protein